MATPYDRTATPVAQMRPGRRGAPLVLAAPVAALWSALLSYGVVLALVATGAVGTGATLTGVMRMALAGWLLGHGVPVETPTDRVTLVPLALTAVAGWRLARAGVHVSRATGAHRERSAERALIAAAAVAAGYAAIGAGAAALARTPTVAISSWRAAATLGVVALAAVGLGALVHARGARALVAGVPFVVRDAVRTGVVAAALVLAAGALVAGIAVATRGSDATEVLGSYRTGILGQAGITLLCLAFAPNLAAWGAAYLLGPGFSVGVDTIVSPGTVVLGPIPPVPPLAGLPTAAVGAWAPLLFAGPVLAAACAGWWLARRAPDHGWATLCGAAALAGPVAGLVVQGATAASAGALGSGRLAALGPSGWTVGLVASAVVAVGAMLGAVGARLLAEHRAARGTGGPGERRARVPAERRSDDRERPTRRPASSSRGR
jgi:hypothetical protein